MLSFQQGGQVVDILLMHLCVYTSTLGSMGQKPNQQILKPFSHLVHYYNIDDVTHVDG
jgi:hypothetical protein